MAATFLGMFSLESAGVLHGFNWMNYCLVIFIAIPLLFLVLVKVEYKRSVKDKLTSDNISACSVRLGAER